MAYKKIRQPKIADVVEQELERLIIEGIWAPGQKLPAERELAKQFDVSRPSIREAIFRLETRQFLRRRQGEGTFVSESLGASLTDPLFDLLGSSHETQFDLLETRHALEGVLAYLAALRGTEEDLLLITQAHQKIDIAIQNKDLTQEAKAVIQELIAIAEASHNMVLLHIVRTLSPLLQENVEQNFELLYRKDDVIEKVHAHRTKIVQAIASRQPEVARQASHDHLAFIEETLLNATREESRRERSLRRIQQNQKNDNDYI